MSSAETVRLGIIGLGYMAQGVHIPCFARVHNCELYGVADNDPHLAGRVARKWHISNVFASNEDLLQSEEIDAVAILVPPQFIAPLAIEALSNGKHVFCEKPLAFTIETNEAVIAAAHQANRKVAVAFQKRYDAGVQYAKTVMSDPKWTEELGRITYARFHNFGGSFRGDLEQPYEKSSHQVEFATLGSIDLPQWVDNGDRDLFFCSYVNASHDLNLMRHLLGEPRDTAAGLRLPGANAWFPYSTTVFDYDDYCAVFEYGLVEHDNMDEWFQIYFERGWIEVRFNRVLLRDMPASVEVMTKSQGTVIPALGYSWSFHRQAEEFIQCCHTDLQPLTDAAETLGDTALAKSWYLAGKKT